MATTAPLRLPRTRRLQQSGDFARLKTAGRRIISGCMIFNWLTLPPGASSRLGVITARRMGGAVVRSRGRRLLREVFRRHQWDLKQPVDLVLVARDSLARSKYDQVERDYLQALRKAGLLNQTTE